MGPDCHFWMPDIRWPHPCGRIPFRWNRFPVGWLHFVECEIHRPVELSVEGRGGGETRCHPCEQGGGEQEGFADWPLQTEIFQPEVLGIGGVCRKTGRYPFECILPVEREVLCLSDIADELFAVEQNLFPDAFEEAGSGM